jgi:putative transcriptional regulator
VTELELFQHVQPNRERKGIIMSKVAMTKQNVEPIVDWSALDAVTEEERHAAALSDPDNLPWTEEQLAMAQQVPRTITLRRSLKLTQEQFAEEFEIPLDVLRDWEERRSEPDRASCAYLRVIAREPDVVRRALAPQPLAEAAE